VCDALDLEPKQMRKFILVAKTLDERYFKTGFDCWYDFLTQQQPKDPVYSYRASK
jgi:hypothetical protein